jgi:hypothetical protein
MNWFADYVRVETDRFLLFVLVLLLMWRHAPENYISMVLGAFIMAIQNNRYSRDRVPADPPAKKEGDNATDAVH